MITTTAQAKGTRDTIAKNKQEAVSKGLRPDTVPVVGVTLGFSTFALKKVSVVLMFNMAVRLSDRRLGLPTALVIARSKMASLLML